VSVSDSLRNWWNIFHTRTYLALGILFSDSADSSGRSKINCSWKKSYSTTSFPVMIFLHLRLTLSSPIFPMPKRPDIDNVFNSSYPTHLYVCIAGRMFAIRSRSLHRGVPLTLRKNLIIRSIYILYIYKKRIYRLHWIDHTIFHGTMTRLGSNCKSSQKGRSNQFRKKRARSLNAGRLCDAWI